MQTLKFLFSKITDDNPIYEKKDVVENIFVFRMLSALRARPRQKSINFIKVL